MVTLTAGAEPPDDTAEPGIPPHIAQRMQAQRGNAGPDAQELPKFQDVAKDYEKVVSTTEGKGLYTIWVRKRDGQMLIELPRNFASQKIFMAYTISGGVLQAGVQYGDQYVYWKRYDKRLALIEPNLAVRTSGDLESKKGHERVFTDRVILDVPIVAMGPGGGPVIDGDALFIGNASKFFGMETAGANRKLATIKKAKSFPENIEVAYTLPLSGGRFGTLSYSLRAIPNKTGYKPRKADSRVGYFTTTHRDVGQPGEDTPWVRYINRWHLEKADPKLRLSPPKEPIIFYLEHTIPVRYRRWVRDGVLEWNKAYEQIGIVNAIEVYQQDAKTGAHMDKDPEDARYNFILWTNASMGFAIGPSRVDPRTGQILDADIVMDEGFITSWTRSWKNLVPQVAMEGMGPATLAWLAQNPNWDPRVRLAPLAERDHVIHQLAMHQARNTHSFGGHPAATADPTLMGDDEYDGLAGRISQINGGCLNAHAKSFDLALYRMSPEMFKELGRRGKGKSDDEDEDDHEHEEEEEEPELDGVPESFIGPLLRDVVMHEVGHTLGLRHNFKGSGVYSIEEMNNEDFIGQAHTGSVMEYSPINVNFEDGPVQGDYTMVTIGPYDYWAIEYGYTFDKKLDPILSRVSEPQLAFATDEDTWGPDPMARRFDFGKDPLDYAESQMRMVQDFRGQLLERSVEDGESWAKAREGYEILLGRHIGAVGIASNWIGGSHINRDLKGDPGDREPIENIPADKQRRALQFVIDNSFNDDAFGLSPELLRKMTLDKWWDNGGMDDIFEDPTWPVHDRIMGIQASAMTRVMNPTTLNRVLDNEFRVPSDEDALTVAEVIFTVSDAVWSEIEQSPANGYTVRAPMVSSLRRNLQREHLDRLIDLSLPNPGFGAASKPVSNLCTFKLRELSEQIGRVLDRGGAKIDPYTVAHLSEAKVRIDKALDAQYIYNTEDMGGGGGMPFFLFGEDGRQR
jgi:hypothetical protein